MLFGTLGASLTGKRVLRADYGPKEGKEILRAGYGSKDLPFLKT